MMTTVEDIERLAAEHGILAVNLAIRAGRCQASTRRHDSTGWEVHVAPTLREAVEKAFGIGREADDLEDLFGE